MPGGVLPRFEESALRSTQHGHIGHWTASLGPRGIPGVAGVLVGPTQPRIGLSTGCLGTMQRLNEGGRQQAEAAVAEAVRRKLQVRAAWLGARHIPVAPPPTRRRHCRPHHALPAGPLSRPPRRPPWRRSTRTATSWPSPPSWPPTWRRCGCRPQPTAPPTSWARCARSCCQARCTAKRAGHADQRAPGSGLEQKGILHRFTTGLPPLPQRPVRPRPALRLPRRRRHQRPVWQQR